MKTNTLNIKGNDFFIFYLLINTFTISLGIASHTSVTSIGFLDTKHFYERGGSNSFSDLFDGRMDLTTSLDTTHAWDHYTLAKHYTDLKKNDSAVYFFKKAASEYRGAGFRKRSIELTQIVGEVFLEASVLDSALYYSEKALASVRRHMENEHSLLCDLYDQLGTIYVQKAKYNDALKYFQHSLNVRDSLFGSDHLEVSKSYNYMAVVYDDMRKFDQSVKLYKQALRIRRKLLGDDNAEVATVYNNLGATYAKLSKFDLAKENYEKALSIRIKVLGARNPDVATTLNNLGIILKNKGDASSAIEYYRKAIDIWTEAYGPKYDRLIGAYMNTGLALSNTGDHIRSISYYEKALTLIRQKYDDKYRYTPVILVNMGNEFQMTEDFDRAKQCYRQALDLSLTLFDEEHHYVLTLKSNLALLKLNEERYDEAREMLEEVLVARIKNLGEVHPYVADIYNNLGESYKREGLIDEAVNYHKKALGLRLRIYDERHPKIAESYTSLGNLSRGKGDYEQAIKYYDESIRATKQPSYKAIRESEDPLKNVNSSSKPALFMALGDKGLALVNCYSKKPKDIRKLELGINTYNKAVELAERMKLEYTNQSTKLAFSETVLPIYQSAALALNLMYQQSGLDSLYVQLFELSEKSKAGILHENLLGAQAKRYARIPDNLLAEENYLLSEIAHHQVEIEKNKNAQNYDSVLVEELEDELFNFNHKYEGLISLFENQYPSYHRIKYQTKNASIHQVQSFLDDHTALVEYFLTDTTLFIFTITSDTHNLITKTVPVDLDSLVRDFHQLLSDKLSLEQSIKASKEGYLQKGHQLYELLLKEPITALNESIEHLILVSDGVLMSIPFEALITKLNSPQTNLKKGEGQTFRHLNYLLNDYEVSYAYSSGLLIEQLNKDARQEEPSKVFAGFAPSYQGFNKLMADAESQPMVSELVRSGNYNLPGAKEEVAKIADLLNGEALFDDLATEKNFKSVASEYQFLHLAMHGLINDKQPSLSKLLFTPLRDSLEDNYLHAAEIYATQINADMIVLSACNSGLGFFNQGEGIMSLSRAFSYAGSPSVMHSLWNAQDKVTSQIMVSFYQGLEEGKTKAEALRDAKLAYLESAHGAYLHPYYWSAFVINGNYEAVDFDESGYTYVWFIGGGLLLLLMFIAALKARPLG